MSHREMREELTCPICMEFFSLPRRLPCGHSYCHDCVKAMLESKAAESGSYLNYSRPLICPECRDEINIDFVRGIEGLPVDFKLSKLVDLFQFMKASDDSDNGGKSGVTESGCDSGDPANTGGARRTSPPSSSPLSTAVSIQPPPSAADRTDSSSHPSSSSNSGASPSHLLAVNHSSLRPFNTQQLTESAQGNAAHRQEVNSRPTDLHSSIVRNSIPDGSLPVPPIPQSNVEEVLAPTTPPSVVALSQHAGDQDMGDVASFPNGTMERLSHMPGAEHDGDSQHLQADYSHARPASTSAVRLDSPCNALGGAVAPPTPLSSFPGSPEPAGSERLGGFGDERPGERMRLREDAINEEKVDEDECVVFEDGIGGSHSRERDEFGNYTNNYVAAFHHSPHRHHRQLGASMSSQLSASLPAVGKKKRESVSSDNSSVVERCISRAHSVPVESKRDSADGKDLNPPVLGNNAENEDADLFLACGEQHPGSDVRKSAFDKGRPVLPMKPKQTSVRDDRWFPDSDSSLSSASSAKERRRKERPRMVRGRRKKWLMTRFFRSMFLSSSSESGDEDDSETGDSEGLRNRCGTNLKGEGHKTCVKAAPQGLKNDVTEEIGGRRDRSNSPTSPDDAIRQQAYGATHEGHAGQGEEVIYRGSKDKREESTRRQESYESNGDFAARHRNPNTLTRGQEEAASLSSLNSKTELKDVFLATDATPPNLELTRSAELDSHALHPARTLYDNVAHSSVSDPLASPRSRDGYDNVTCILNSPRERCETDEQVLVRSPDFNPCREPCPSVGGGWRNNRLEEPLLPSGLRVDARTLYDNLDYESMAPHRNYSDANILSHRYEGHSRLHSHSETDIENLKTGYECSENGGQSHQRADRGVPAGHLRTFEATPRTSLSAENIGNYAQVHRNRGRRGEPLGCATDGRREYFPSSYCNVSCPNAENSPIPRKADSPDQFYHCDRNVQAGNAASGVRLRDNGGTNEGVDMGFGELSLNGETASVDFNIPKGATYRNIDHTGPAMEERGLCFLDNHFNNRSGQSENQSREPSASCEKSTMSKTMSTNEPPSETHVNAGRCEPVEDQTSKIKSQNSPNSEDERHCGNDKFDDGDNDDSSSAGAPVVQVKKKTKSGIKRFLTSLLSLSSTSSSDDEMDNHNDKTSSKSSDW